MRKIRYLTDAAMVCAISVVFLLISRLTGGFIEDTCAFLLPIPIAIYTIKYGFKYGIIPTIASTIIAFLVLNPIRAACFIAPANIVGLIYGAVAKNRKNIYIKLLVAILGSLFINVLTTVIFSKVLFGYTIIEDTKLLVSQMASLLSFLNLSETFVATLEALMIGLIPSVLIAVSILEGILTHAFTSELARRVFKIQEASILEGFRLAIPRIVSYFIVPFMILGVFGIFYYTKADGFLHVLFTIAINITFVFAILYLLQGLMVISVFLEKRQMKAMIFVVLILIFILPIPIILIGIIDSLFDLKMRILLS